jgi:hypothetical protein
VTNAYEGVEQGVILASLPDAVCLIKTPCLPNPKFVERRHDVEVPPVVSQWNAKSDVGAAIYFGSDFDAPALAAIIADRELSPDLTVARDDSLVEEKLISRRHSFDGVREFGAVAHIGLPSA